MKLRSSLNSNRVGMVAVLLVLCLGVVGSAQAQTATLSQTSMVFSPTLIGDSSVASVNLSNTGSAALAISSISLGGSFSQTNTCGTGLAGGARCSISITFTPTVSGLSTTTLTISDNASGSPHVVNISGTGLPPAYLSAVNLSYGNQAVGTTSAAKTITITNRQTTPLGITVGISGDFAQSNTCLAAIPASGTCTFSISFTPANTGNRTGTLTVTPSVGPALAASLTGAGISAFTLSPMSLSFPNQTVSSASAAKTVTMTNTQGAPLAISNLAISAQFTQTNSCGSSLAAGASCTYSVAFAPTVSGAAAGSLSFSVNGASPVSISLSGTAISAYSMSATSLDFGTQALGTTSAPLTVTVTNNQSVALVISSAAASSGFSQTNTCGASVAAGASCTFFVTFTPATAASTTGTLTFAASNGVSPQTISLKGAGLVAYTLSASTVAFGNLAQGNTSAAKTVVLTNNQASSLGISNVAVSAGFAQTNNCGSSVAAKASCTFSLTFLPTTLGSATGSLTFAASNGVSPQSISLSGTGIAPVVVSPASIMFSPLAAGTTSGASNVTVRNNQNVALGITGISISGAFAQTNNCGSSIAAGTACTIGVTFNPIAMGATTGSLTISDDAATAPQAVVSLTGTGLSPMYLSVASLAFGSQATGGTTAAKSLTVKNNANVAYNITGITITADYAQTNNCPASLAAGATCTISVVFAPTAAGSRPGTLTIAESSLISPLTASLSGTGTAGLTSITVSPASLSLGIGGQQQFSASGKYSDNSIKDITNAVVWTSGNPAVSISSTGFANVVSTPDIAIPITATSGGIVSAPAWLSALSSLPRVCPVPTIDMKLLVVTNGQTEADFPAVKQILDYLGTPYTVFDMAANPGGITTDLLSDGVCHGFYQGVIFTYGGYIYTLPGMSTLTSYEQTFGVRQLNWFTYPGTDFGFNAPTSTISSNSTYSANFTAAGSQIFYYANTSTPLAISSAAVYLSTPSGSNSTALLSDNAGNALSVVYSFADGRQYLSQAFDSNQYLTHNLILSYGLINWVTKGVFLGEYHVYASASVDDFFIGDAEWVPGTACTNPITHDRTASDDPSLPNFRVNAADMAALVNWQNSVQADPLFSTFKLSMAFNGVGTAGNKDWTGLPASGVANDDLVGSFSTYEQYFHWMSHTYDHPETLDGLTKSGPADANGDTIDLEVLTNLWVAGDPNGVKLDTDPSDSGLQQLHFTDFNPHSMITPGVTGLDDPNSSQYLYQDGIFYVVSDTSVTPTATNNNGPNPSPNVGIVNSYAPGIYEVPRHANDVYFNAANWNDDAAEFHCIYGPEGSNQTPYSNYNGAQILDFVTTGFVNNMLKGDMDSEMFHQPNLHAYDGTHSLMSDTYDMTFSKYKTLYRLPVLSPTLDQAAEAMKARNNYNLSGATGTIVGGATPTITITVPPTSTVSSATIPVTGLNSTGAEVYGGNNISHITATPGAAITLPLQ